MNTDTTPELDLRTFGARAVLPKGVMSIGDAAPKDVAWNFGVLPKTEEVDRVLVAKGSLYSRFPVIAGKWDGKSTVNHWDAVLKNYSGDWVKAEELIQHQPRGTCGGRAGSLACDMVQHILIASGRRAKFYRTSHAAVYFMARKIYNMLNGNWQNEDDDGVASGSVPEAIGRLGLAHREETADSKWYGPGSDDLACQLGAGMHPALAAKILELAKDNLVSEWATVSNAQELADGIAAGGIGIGSDSQGFSHVRDKDGFSSPKGRWDHYHVRASVGSYNGRKGFGYCQSWGKDSPSGPRLPGHPGNCFGVDWDVQDHVIKTGDWAVVFGFPLWDLQNGSVDIPWTF